MKLADGIEEADGPSRELDKEIAKAIGFFDGTRASYDLQLDLIPAYTASIDAAKTLVPEGMGASVYWPVGEGSYPKHAAATIDRYTPWSASASTPALALCAAAIRAQEAGE